MDGVDNSSYRSHIVVFRINHYSQSGREEERRIGEREWAAIQKQLKRTYT